MHTTTPAGHPHCRRCEGSGRWTDRNGYTLRCSCPIECKTEAYLLWVNGRGPHPDTDATPVVVTPAGLQHLLPGYEVPAVQIAQEVRQPRMF